MKILALKDNALFMQNWRERMRFSAFTSGILLTSVMIFLIFINAYFNETEWLKKTFWHITFLQGFLLLFVGTLSADRMTVRERSSGTLDFHRSSPTSRFNQYLGLLLGTTCMEWTLFLGTLIISTILMFIANIPSLPFLNFYLALILCTLFYHSLAILLAVATSRKGILSHRRFGALQLLVVAYISLGVFQNSHISSFYHLTWLPCYDQMAHELFDYGANWPYASYQNKVNVLYALFGIPLPSLIIQILTQVPLLVLLALGIIKKISYQERAAFSKQQTAIFVSLILFLFVASAYSYLLNGGTYYYCHSCVSQVNMTLKSVIPFFIFLVIALGTIGILTVTPSQLFYYKGFIRMKKQGLKKINLDYDYSSNVWWVICFCFITISMFIILRFTIPSSFLNQCVGMMFLLSYIVFFAGIVEYFKLSRHHKKLAIFVSMISILWIFLPLLANIIDAKKISSSLYYLLISLSPFWGVDIIYRTILGIPLENENFCHLKNSWTYLGLSQVSAEAYLSLVINMVLASLAQILAAKERLKCKEKVLKNADR